jgi:hypothetical protein
MGNEQCSVARQPLLLPYLGLVCKRYNVFCDDQVKLEYTSPTLAPAPATLYPTSVTTPPLFAIGQCSSVQNTIYVNLGY